MSPWPQAQGAIGLTRLRGLTRPVSEICVAADVAALVWSTPIRI